MPSDGLCKLTPTEFIPYDLLQKAWDLDGLKRTEIREVFEKYGEAQEDADKVYEILKDYYCSAKERSELVTLLGGGEKGADAVNRLCGTNGLGLFRHYRSYLENELKGYGTSREQALIDLKGLYNMLTTSEDLKALPTWIALDGLSYLYFNRFLSLGYDDDHSLSFSIKWQNMQPTLHIKSVNRVTSNIKECTFSNDRTNTDSDSNCKDEIRKSLATFRTDGSADHLPNKAAIIDSVLEMLK